jgi:hypothetical protein
VQWIKGRTRTEICLLHAFLMYNREFEIVFYSRYLFAKHRHIFAGKVPLF